MKRRVVQHGPSTLTISLPSKWAQDYGIKKGDFLNMNEMPNGLLIATPHYKRFDQKEINVHELRFVTKKTIAAFYKAGYDELTLHYKTHEELENIHEYLAGGYIGFEIVDETKDTIHIKKVSEPQQDEFNVLFRRIFHFLATVAEETHDAAQTDNKQMFSKLVLRDDNINKLADFCRRMVNSGVQTTYTHDTALYHIIEQLEKIGDIYKNINATLINRKGNCSQVWLLLLERVNKLLRSYEDLFFQFSFAKADKLYAAYKGVLGDVEQAANTLSKNDIRLLFLIENIATELYNLLGATMMLNL